MRYSMAIVNLVSWSSSLKILLVHFVNRQLLYHTDELFQPYVLLFGSRRQEKKTDYWKGKMTKDFQWGDRKAKFLQKMKMTRQSFLLLIYFWLNMTERLSWGKELLLTADNIATPNLHTISTLYKEIYTSKFICSSRFEKGTTSWLVNSHTNYC